MLDCTRDFNPSLLALTSRALCNSGESFCGSSTVQSNTCGVGPSDAGDRAPLGCQVRRLQLPRGHCRSYRDVQLWSDGCQRANLVFARLVGVRASEPWDLFSNRAPHWKRGLSFTRIGLHWLPITAPMAVT